MLNFHARPRETQERTTRFRPEPSGQALIAPAEDQPATITQALQRLDALIARHGEWLKHCHLALIADRGDGSSAGHAPFADADHRAWLDLLDNPVFADSKARAGVVAALTRMVAAAGHLSAVADREPAFCRADYARFLDAVLAFQQAVRGLQSETWNLLANIDSLTGLGNRQAMFHRLSVECERHARSRLPCTLAMIDLDAFKPINDRYGHAAGDVVLSAVAAALADSIRPYDALFRYGGDEFALCLPNTDTRSAWAIVERLRCKVGGLAIQLREHTSAQASMSAGIAPLTSEFGVHAALEAADAALYRAKSQGRNAIYVWSPDC